MSFETVVQTAILNKLTSDAALMAVVVSVSDAVLQGDDSLNRANLVQSGYKLININRVNSESQLDSDGFTRHGIQTFNLIIQEL